MTGIAADADLLAPGLRRASPPLVPQAVVLQGQKRLLVQRDRPRLWELRVQRKAGCLIGVLLWMLSACQSPGIFQGGGQERAFRAHYINTPLYTAMLIQPYQYHNEYLIDLTGRVAESDPDLMRAPVVVPLGSPITLVGIEGRHILARIPGHARLFRILVQTQHGTSDEVAKELAVVVAPEPPWQRLRPELRAVVERQEVMRGMSRREVLMSWGLPDKITTVPGAAGTLEAWIYLYKRVHLFLDNGLVTNWQQF